MSSGGGDSMLGGHRDPLTSPPSLPAAPPAVIQLLFLARRQLVLQAGGQEGAAGTRTGRGGGWGGAPWCVCPPQLGGAVSVPLVYMSSTAPPYSQVVLPCIWMTHLAWRLVSRALKGRTLTATFTEAPAMPVMASPCRDRQKNRQADFKPFPPPPPKK